MAGQEAAPVPLASGGQGSVSIVQAQDMALACKKIPAKRIRVSHAELGVVSASGLEGHTYQPRTAPPTPQAGALGTLPEHHAHILQLLQRQTTRTNDELLYYELGLMDLHDFLSLMPLNRCVPVTLRVAGDVWPTSCHRHAAHPQRTGAATGRSAESGCCSWPML